MTLTPLLLLLLGPRLSPLHPWLFGRYGMVGCEAFKDRVSQRDGALSAIDIPTSTSLATLLCTSMSAWLISCLLMLSNL